ncbi:MAG TPA: ribonuclease D [Gammaproteobacteria bacterium]
MSRFAFIDSSAALGQFLDDTAGTRLVALDTEFMREKTYYPRLCLVQVAAGEQIACIDPLALDDLGPLWERLSSAGTCVLLHAGRQDLEVIFQASGKIPASVFDTQIAASLCGYGDQTGYAALVRDILGVELDKSMTRADWSRRPLSQDALEYAADDVRYLRALHEHLSSKLESLGREDWLEPELEVLTEPSQYRLDPAKAWKRIRAAAKLKPKEVAILRALAEWREREAMRVDRPRQWLLKDDALVFIAQRPPKNVAALTTVRGVEEGFALRHGETLLKLIDTARTAPPPEDLPAMRERLTLSQEAQADLLMAALKAIANANELAPASIANRKEIERLVRGDRNLDLLKGWRRAAAGLKLVDILEGRMGMMVAAGGVRFLDEEEKGNGQD